MAIECFEIRWTKLFSYEQAETQPEARDMGVYARVIGKARRIHYIGKSKDLSERCRTYRHGDRRSGTSTAKHYVSFGLIRSFEMNKSMPSCTPRQLTDIESYLRNIVKPKGNDISTLRGYHGNPLLIVNTDKVLKPIQKIMTSNADLAKLIATKAKRKPSSSSWLP